MLPPNALVVVADGHSAHLYRNHGHAEVELVLQETLHAGDLSDNGPSGAIPKDHSSRDVDEATFAKLLVNRLNAMALSGDLPEAVAIVADPSSLGQMRPQFHVELKRRIVMEVPKTLVKASAQDLAKALAQA